MSLYHSIHSINRTIQSTRRDKPREIPVHHSHTSSGLVFESEREGKSNVRIEPFSRDSEGLREGLESYGAVGFEQLRIGFQAEFTSVVACVRGEEERGEEVFFFDSSCEFIPARFVSYSERRNRSETMQLTERSEEC